MQRERLLSYLYVFPLIGMAVWSRMVHRDKTERDLRDRWDDLIVIDRHNRTDPQASFDRSEPT